MSKVSKKKLLSPTVQHPAARWAFVLVLCAALGIVASYYWRVFYGWTPGALRRWPSPAFVWGSASWAGTAALLLRRVKDFAKRGHGVHPFVRYVVRFCKSADADTR